MANDRIDRDTGEILSPAFKTPEPDFQATLDGLYVGAASMSTIATRQMAECAMSALETGVAAELVVKLVFKPGRGDRVAKVSHEVAWKRATRFGKQAESVGSTSEAFVTQDGAVAMTDPAQGRLF